MEEEANGAPAGGGALVATGAARDVVRSGAGAGDPVDTHTQLIGVIVPPPDIKAIADKTAQFVARNGAQARRRRARRAARPPARRPIRAERALSAAAGGSCRHHRAR
jgi:hypothetical protein